MYEYIRGKLAHITPNNAVIDAHGIGYKLLIPPSAYSELAGIDCEVTFFTSFVVRETEQLLFGFLSPQERDLFETITTISGIGPKTALSVIGHLPLEELHQAVANHDVKAISRVPGIGKKTAERLIMEMQDKSFSSLPSTLKVESAPQQQIINDAMRALINLGYNQIIAQNAIKTARDSLGNDVDLSSLISASLQTING